MRVVKKHFLNSLKKNLFLHFKLKLDYNRIINAFENLH
jgi:hypothetical protein